MQFSSAAKPPRGVLFDSSFGETIDTVLALGLLHGFEGKQRCRIAALTISKSNLKAAQLCDVIEKFYASATTGIAAIFMSAAPIGLAVDGKLRDDTPLLTGALAKKDAEGKEVYAPRVRKENDTAIAEVLMRNALTAQHDQNAVMVSVGPSTNVVRLLGLAGTKELVAAKVKHLVITPNLAADPAAAKRVFEEWPAPLVMCGPELGDQIKFPGASIEKDFAYNPNHPIADAYRANHAMPYDAPTGAMAAMLYAIRPDDGYFKLSEPGTFSIDSNGRAQFQPSAQGKHHYLTLDASRKEDTVKTYVEMASAKPVPRSFRRLQQLQEMQDQQEKQEKAKPSQIDK